MLLKYSAYQSRCCNPFKLEEHTATKSLRIVNLEVARDLKALGIGIKPGEKLCPTCRIKVEQKKPEPTDSNENDSDGHDFTDVATNLQELNSSFMEVDVSPVKLHGISKHRRVHYGKRKLSELQSKLKQKQIQVHEKMANALDVTPTDIESKQQNEIVQKKVLQNSDDLNKLLEMMKEKIQLSPRKIKIQVLTLTPLSWTVRKTAEFFSVSNFMVQTAFRLRREKGILAIQDVKKGNELHESVKNLVREFYCDDENSRLLPGKKDFVSIGKKHHIQKRLILSNLKELHSSFKEKNPDVKVGFSKFCMLRPKWCITVGASGTHSVCVCTAHQNVTLLLKAINLEKTYHELIEMIVCDRHSKECMLHRCLNCPGVEPLKGYLITAIRKYIGASFDKNKEDSQEDDEPEITFNQWSSTDRAELTKHSISASSFVELLSEKLDIITSHSFIAKAQSQFLKQEKDHLSENEALILVDFAENYKFLVQDEIQGYHWNKTQCTVHPVVIYTKRDGILVDESICFISDDLCHDVDMVYKILKETVTYVTKHVNQQCCLVHYFSDGCAGQYKNCKNFLNLCHHKDDFGINCKWSFFATSHGKSACDGVGGTVKRLTARASLQRPFNDQILSAQDMYKFCKEDIKGIKFFFIAKEDMTKTREALCNRYVSAKTVPGTRGFHQFVPLSSSSIGAKRISADSNFSLKFDFYFSPERVAIEFSINCFVICIYDGEHWVGLIDDVDKDLRDARVKFMHPKCTAVSYFWPTRDDVCWVPDENILHTISIPTTVTGRQYKLQQKDSDILNKIMNN